MDYYSYKKQIKILCKAIGDIKYHMDENSISKEGASEKIMKLLRNQCLFINRDYLLAAHNKPVTIVPDDPRVKLNLAEDDYATEWYAIWGNSFGPFNLGEYFKEGNFRILWLLKEPFIEKESWIKGDRGGNDQAYDNRCWDLMEENKTLENLIHRTQEILDIVNPQEEKYIEQDAMNHICILEVNHFPGLAFNNINSDDGSIGKWADSNAPLIRELIGFYRPDIVIGGFTLGHFFPEGYRYDKSIGINKHFFSHIKSGIDSGINMLKEFGYTSLKGSENNKEEKHGYIFNSDERCIFIDANHPCDERNYNKDDAQKYGLIAKQMLN